MNEKITGEWILRQSPAALVDRCLTIDPELTSRAAEGAAWYANTSGILWMPKEEAAEMFAAACRDWLLRRGEAIA